MSTPPPTDDGAAGRPNEHHVTTAQTARGRDSGMATVVAAVAITAAVLSVGALVFYGGRAGLAVAVGGSIAVVNLLGFVWIVRGVLEGTGRRRRVWMFLGFVKILALFGGVWLLLRSGWLPPIGLIVGYGALPIGIGVGGLLGPRDAEASDAGEANTGGGEKEVIGGSSSSENDASPE